MGAGSGDEGKAGAATSSSSVQELSHGDVVGAGSDGIGGTVAGLGPGVAKAVRGCRARWDEDGVSGSETRRGSDLAIAVPKLERSVRFLLCGPRGVRPHGDLRLRGDGNGAEHVGVTGDDIWWASE